MKQLLILMILLLSPYRGVANPVPLPPLPPQNQTLPPALPQSPDPEDLLDVKELEEELKGQGEGMERPKSTNLASIQKVWNGAVESAGVYHVLYSPHDIIKLRLREYMHTTIVLPQWEDVEEIILGDSELFSVQKMKKHVFVLRPQLFHGVDTNITVIGKSGLIYSFYVRTEGIKSQNVSDLVVYVKANPPLKIENHKNSLDETLIAEKKTDQKDWIEAVEFNPARLTFDFSMVGERSIAPQRVYSNGVLTWFDYGEGIKHVSLPVISGVVDGVDTPINVSRMGNMLVAQGSGTFTLRHGQKVTCVYPTPET